MNCSVIKKNIGIIILWLVFLVSFIFVYSEAYLSLTFDYMRELVLAFMAASVTILITALLLRQQTNSEELKDSHVEIFRKKFEIYEEFFEKMIFFYEDGTDYEKKQKALETCFYKLLLFMQTPSSFHQLYDVVFNHMQHHDSKQISQLINVLREELGIHEDNHNWRNPEFCRELDEKMKALAQYSSKTNLKK